MRKLVLITVLLWAVSACLDDSECKNEDCCGYLTQADDIKKTKRICDKETESNNDQFSCKSPL